MPFPGSAEKLIGAGQREAARARRRHDRRGQRMLTRLLERSSETQRLVLRVFFAHNDRHDRRFAFGQRAGLVHDDRIHALQPLERLRVLDEDASRRAAARADHDGHRRRETERAGTRDDEHRHGADERERQTRRRPPDVPDDECDHRDQHDRGNEVGRDAVREPLNRRAAALGFADHSDNLREQAVVAHALGADEQAPGRVDRAAGDARSGFLRDRHRLAGDHRLVDGAVSVDDDAVDRDLLAGPDAADIADRDVAERDIALFAVG